MASPVNDTYACASGGTIHAGFYAGLAGSIVVAGDSLTDYSFDAAGYRWGMPLARSPWPIIYNAGVSGNTIQNLIDRWSADVLAKSPAIVMVRIGTNSTAVATATWKSQYDTLIASLLANNIFGIFHAVPPRAGTTVPRAMSDYLAAQCAAHPGKLQFIDDSLALGDGGYNYLAAYLPDGIHPNGKGTHAQGVGMVSGLTTCLTPNDPRPTDAADTYYLNSGSNQWVKNPLMAGAGPDFWSVGSGGSGTSATASKVAADVGDPNQTPWLRTTINSTGGANHWISISTTLGHPAVAADLTVKRLDVVAEVRLNALAGAAISKFYIECIDGSNRVAPTLSLTLPSDETLTHTMLLRTSLARGDINAVVAHSANTIQFTLGLIAAAAMGSGVGSIDLRCVSVRALGA